MSSKKIVCVLFAFIDEVKHFLETYEAEIMKIEEVPYPLYMYKNSIIVISGIGLINAASCITYVEEKYHPDEYLNLGLAGSSNENYEVLDVVFVDRVYHGGVDATAFGYEYGQTPREKLYYDSFPDTFKKIAESGYPIRHGILSSTDSFINDNKSFSNLNKKLSEKIDIMDMEAYAFFQIANKYNKKISSAKIVSDILDIEKENNNIQFKEILTLGSEKISEIVIKFLMRKG